jgi:hypothetical protein
MPRKKKPTIEQPVKPIETAGASIAVAEAPPVTSAAPAEVPVPAELPPPVVAEPLPPVVVEAKPAPVVQPQMKPAPQPARGVAPSAEQRANPYMRLFACDEKGFEMGEHRQFKQRVFLFDAKPSDQIRATLKDHGFTYRAAEKAWTIPATAENRLLSEHLAKVFAGQEQSQGISR